jgi:hypothetical protein
MRMKLDSDALICQALIWLLLLGYVALVYVVAVAIASLPFGRPSLDFSPAWWQNLIGLTAIVLTFFPVYRWVRVRVRALIYGQHENPFPALVQLHQHFESTPSPYSILPTIAETIAQSLKLPFVEIKAQIPEMQSADAPLVTAVGSPPKNAAIEQVPLTYQGIAIGELRVAGMSHCRTQTFWCCTTWRDR